MYFNLNEKMIATFFQFLKSIIYSNYHYNIYLLIVSLFLKILNYYVMKLQTNLYLCIRIEGGLIINYHMIDVKSSINSKFLLKYLKMFTNKLTAINLCRISSKILNNMAMILSIQKIMKTNKSKKNIIDQ